MAEKKNDDLFGLDRELDEFEDRTEDIEEELDGYEETDGAVDIISEIKEKAIELAGVVEDKAYEICMEPDEKTLVDPDRSLKIVVTAAVLAVLVGIGAVLFCGLYPWKNTGVKAKDFIRNFNEIIVDEKVGTIFENYQDITIPEKAKLGGKHEIAIYGGHVIISADVSPTGYIRSLSTRTVDLPGYDPEQHTFVSEGTDDMYYYYVALGKVVVALQKAYSDSLPEADAVEEQEAVSAADVSASDAPKGQYTVFDAAVMGYQVISYAQLYNSFGYAPEYTMDFGNMHIAYNDPAFELKVTSSETTLAKLPEGLQKLFEKSEPEKEAADSSAPADGVSSADSAA